jgi:eukaryotic-like serine/threonine-protein kinase
MPLSPGARLGPYEILSVIGAGGMGEVYQARDTRLDRVVAIKRVLGTLAGDQDLRARFQHEARTIAALNHPHICTIHDVGHDEGIDYLVMEHLAGETLAERLARGAVAIDEALRIAIQIAEALDRAHRAGIVHRDLKPANVMLVGARPASDSSARRGSRPAIDVKLLDFGLAKRASAAAGPGDLSVAATMVSPPSDAGMMLGTLQYMAPEQVEGLEADTRTDIFALGALLYEMLTGAKAFEGKSTASLTAAILERQPAPIREQQPLVLEQLEHVAMQCLDKDPDRRWQSIADVAAELRWIVDHPQPPALTTAAAARGRRPLTWAIVPLAMLAGAAIAGVVAWSARATPAAAPTVRFEVPTPPTDDPVSMALSADGRQLAYVAKGARRQQIWIRALDRLEARPLPGTEGGSYPFWSPDGRAIGFFAENKLKRIDVAGGMPLVMTDAANARGGAWTAQGVILFAPGVNAPIMRISTAGGTPSMVTHLGPETGPAHRWPQFLPGGQRFIFQSALGTAETNGVYLASLDGRKPVRVMARGYAARFVPPGTLLVVDQEALLAFDFDVEKGIVSGEPTTIAQGPGGGVGTAALTTSDAGVVAYRIGGGQQRQLRWVDRHGLDGGVIGEPTLDATSAPELSPDGRTLAVFRQPQGINDVWLLEVGRGVYTRLTAGPPTSASPLWSPDGRSLVYSSRRGGGGIFRKSVSGSTEEETVLAEPNNISTPLSWSPDGRLLVFRAIGEQTGPDLFAIDMNGNRKPFPVVQTPFDEAEAQISPDGRWLAYGSNESGRYEIYLRPFPAGGTRVQVSAAGGAQVRWAPDGKELFYVAPDSRMMAVAVRGGSDAPEVSAPVALFPTNFPSGTNVLGSKPQYVVARDGRFLLNTAVEAANTPPIALVLNWHPDRRK